MKLVITISLLFSLSYIFSQNKNTYFGKRYFVNTEFVGNFPLVYNISKRGEKYNHDMTRKTDLLNQSFHFIAGVILKRNIAISLDLSKGYFDVCPGSTKYRYGINPNPIFYNDGEYKYIHTETMQAISNSFMLKFELTNKRNLFPLGISNQVGIGLSFSKIINNYYRSQVFYSNYYMEDSEYYDSDNYYDINPTFLNKHLYNYEEQKAIKTLDIMYGLTKRTPISKNIFIQSGVRILFHVKINRSSGLETEPGYIYSRYKIEKEIFNQMSMNIIHFNLGVCYVF